MRVHSRWPLVISALALITACKLTKEPERGTTQKWNEADGNIAIALPISMELSVIRNRLNAEIPAILHNIDLNTESVCVAKTRILQFRGLSTSWSETCIASTSAHVKGRIERAGNINVVGEGGKIVFMFPIRAHAQVRPSGHISRLTGFRETIQAAATIKVAADVSLTEDWQPNVKLAGDFSWDQRPQIELFNSIKITFGSQVEDSLRKALDKEMSRLPAKIPANFVRDNVQPVWKRMFDLHKVSSTPESWLRFQPQSVFFSGVDVSTNAISARLGLSGVGRAVIGGAPPPSNATALPRLTLRAPPSNFSSVEMPILLSYRALERQFLNALSGTVFSIEDDDAGIGLKGSKFEVFGLSLFPSGENLGLELQVRIDVPGKFFDVKGSIFLLGRPVVQADKTTIKIENLNITPITDSMFVDAAAIAVMKMGIINAIDQDLLYNFKSDRDKVVGLMNASINRTLTKEISMHGNIRSAHVSKISITQQWIVLSTFVEFSAGLKIVK